jgi:RimJ/RimL family protein N-acetyltransferase
VQRITGLVGEGNAAARRFDEHLGFTLETKLTGAHPTGDLLVYVMWKHDCIWLEKNHAQ